MSAPDTAPDTAMVLAAGLGTRMGALTASTPKPLLRAGGRALIDHALDRAAEGGATRAVVNLHYFPERIRAHLAGRSAPRILFSDETDALLETGGGMRRALPLLGIGPVWAINSDAVFGGPAPLPALSAAWDPARMDALLLLVAREDARAYTRAGDFFAAPDGRLTRRGDRPLAPLVYTGVQIIRAGAFAEGPEGAFSTNLIWDRMLAAGRVYGALHHGPWVDVGTPAGLAEAEAVLAAETPA